MRDDERDALDPLREAMREIASLPLERQFEAVLRETERVTGSATTAADCRVLAERYRTFAAIADAHAERLEKKSAQSH